MNKIQEFLESVTVIDTETTNIDTNVAEIIEIASCRYFDNNWEAASILFGSENPIPPEASAVHNISNNMIKGKPLFIDELDDAYAFMFVNDTSYMVAHNSEYDRAVLNNNIIRTFNQTPFEKFQKKESWICTYRLAKAIFNGNTDLTQYKLNYLRYALNLDIPDDAVAHRAAHDTQMCAVLFEFLVNTAVNKGLVSLDGDIGEQLVDLCWAPRLLDTWPFGKHRGTPMNKVPMDYISWAINKPLDSLDENNANYDMDLAYTIMTELDRRS